MINEFIKVARRKIKEHERETDRQHTHQPLQTDAHSFTDTFISLRARPRSKINPLNAPGEEENEKERERERAIDIE